VRDLREAAREGRHALLVSLWRFPKRHPAMIAGVAATLAFCLLFFELVDTQRDVRGLRPRIERVESGDPCVELSQAVKERAKAKVRPLTRQCISFLDALGPLVSLKLSCAILDEGGYECPKPGSEVAQKGVDAGSGTSSPHGQPSPASVGGKKTSDPSHPHKKRSAPPAAGPALAAPAVPPAQPGNSGNGASAEHGVDTCVNVVVSGCVKAGVELP
jgi:hypothetical protein